MSESEIARIESALSVRLPAFYREFLLTHSAELSAMAETIPSRAMPFRDAESIIAANRIARDPSELHRFAKNWVPWPTDWLIMGKHFCDDHWLIRLDDTDERVWIHWASTGDLEVGYESLEDLLSEIRLDLQRPHEWQAPPTSRSG
jgi:hypothetical protein